MVLVFLCDGDSELLLLLARLKLIFLIPTIFYVIGRYGNFGKMQHTPVTIEDQLISKAVREECSWENLPKRLQSILGSKDEWHRRLVFFFMLSEYSGSEYGYISSLGL